VYTVDNENTSILHPVELQPDAAITVGEDYFLMAMMKMKERKKETLRWIATLPRVCSQKVCRLWRYKMRHNKRKQTISYPIYLPFVIGRGGRACEVFCDALGKKLGVYHVCLFGSHEEPARKNQAGSCNCCPSQSFDESCSLLLLIWDVSKDIVGNGLIKRIIQTSAVSGHKREMTTLQARAAQAARM